MNPASAECKEAESQFLGAWKHPATTHPRPEVLRICEVFVDAAVFGSFMAYQSSVAARVGAGGGRGVVGPGRL